MRLAALVLLPSLALAMPPTVNVSIDQPFALEMGQSASGPGGLQLRFGGSGPSFQVTQAGRELSLLWARGPEGTTPVARALLAADEGELFLTVEAMPDESHLQLRLSRATLTTLTWGKALELPWGAFARDPDQRTWTVGRFSPTSQGVWLELRLQGRGESPSSRSISTSGGKSVTRDGPLLVMVEHDMKSPRGVRLTLRKPSVEVGTFTLGAPFSLVPDESAAGAGLTVRLVGYGHKLDMERRDHPFVEVALEAGGERQSMRFFRERNPEPQDWRGFEVRMTACEDSGPPHSATAKTTFVVTRR